MVKRKRVASESGANRSKGNEIPDPPSSLVCLLQNDKEVLKYFTALQENLVKDVKRWKDKALDYKNQLENMEGRQGNKKKADDRKAATVQKDVQPKTGKEYEKIPSSIHLEDAESYSKNSIHSYLNYDGSSVSQDDRSLDSLLKGEMRMNHEKSSSQNHSHQEELDEDYSSSSGFSELAREMNAQMANETVDSSFQSSTKDRDVIETRKQIMALLIEAYENLTYCGVQLVYEKDVTSDSDEGDVDVESVQPVLKITARADEDVIRDIFKTIRELIRAPTLRSTNYSDHYDDVLKWYNPFISKGLIPACCKLDLNTIENRDDQQVLIRHQHPLVEGLERIIKSLTIMDTYCEYLASNEDEFEHIIQHSTCDEKTTSCIKEGMNHRKISTMILDSLEGEIISVWPTAERISRVSSRSSDFEIKEADATPDDEASFSDSIKDSSSFHMKTQHRLFLLLEKICFVRVVCKILNHRKDGQRMLRLLIHYLLSSVPSEAFEDYSSYAPAMSMCIVEVLLQSVQDSPSLSNMNFLEQTSMNYIHLQNSFCRALLSSHKIWKERMDSSDRKIREWACVENASFHRIKERYHVIFTMADYRFDAKDAIEKLCHNTIDDVVFLCTSMNLSVLNYETIDGAKELCEIIANLIQLHSDGSDRLMNSLSHVLATNLATTVSLHRRYWEAICAKGLSMEKARRLADNDYKLSTYLDSICLTIAERMHHDQANEITKILLKLSLRLCIILGDGDVSLSLAKTLLNPENSVYLDRQLCKSLATLSGFPLVRVINLQVREDRWVNFVTQARQSQLLFVLAVPTLVEDVDQDNSSQFWGEHAFCGKDVDHVTFERNISPKLPIGRTLKSFVSSHWRPFDLKTFDSNAPNHDRLVRISVTERACALSHIASWVGIKNSLTVSNIKKDRVLPFKISGYAQGPPLLIENKGIAPTPVCIVLEDDALLVDRFREKLGEILMELPRDFHFCSLGYSRPKNAPMIHFSQHLGLPTCLWYLTGYILSMAGAEFLLNSLPCVGPVDSWIGLKIASNWENEYGHRIGVGNVKAFNDMSLLPKRKQLGDFIKFRAFAALAPLCSQKVAWKDNPLKETFRWRDRDTDITYSGNQ